MWNVSGNVSTVIGGDEVNFDPGSAAIKLLEADGTVRPPTSADAARLSRLVHQLKNLKLSATALVPSDVPNEISGFYRLYIALQTCDKPLITGLYRHESFPALFEILKIVRGSEEEVAAKPLVVLGACPFSPLRWSELTSESIILCAQRGIPSEIVSVPLTGATGPVTLSGTLVLHTVENLAGITLAQAVRPGAPVIYGGAPCLMDMRAGQTPFGSIETMMIDSA